LITDWVDFMDLVTHATKNADLEKHRTKHKSDKVASLAVETKVEKKG
jgi:hypothetical protein